MLKHDPAAGERARTTGLRNRTTWVRPLPDGTAVLAVTGDAGRCAAAYSRVDTIARALKAAGHGAPLSPDAPADHHERTLAQLRSDVLIDLVLYGQVLTPQPASIATPDETPDAAEPSQHEQVGACDLPRLGQLPPAVAHVTVALSTLLGLDDHPGTLHGVGAVTAAHVRELATTAGSIWRRLVTDPLTGRAVTLDPRRYRPPTSVADDAAPATGSAAASAAPTTPGPATWTTSSPGPPAAPPPDQPGPAAPPPPPTQDPRQVAQPDGPRRHPALDQPTRPPLHRDRTAPVPDTEPGGRIGNRPDSEPPTREPMQPDPPPF